MNPNRHLVPLIALLWLGVSAPALHSQTLSPWTALNPVQSFGFDSIDVTDVGDAFSIPIFSRPGRGLSLQARLNYNSLAGSQISSMGLGGHGWMPNVLGGIGGGASYMGSCGTVTPIYDDETGDIIGYDDDESVSLYEYWYNFIDIYGGVHPFGGYYTTGSDDPATDCPAPSGGFTSTANDQSGYSLVVSDGGVPIAFDSAGNTIEVYGEIDRNGNRINLSLSETWDATNDAYDETWTFFDTLNPSVAALTVAGEGNAAVGMTFSWAGTGGHTLSAVEHFTHYASLCNPRGCGYGAAAGDVPTEIDLPDSTSYLFGYTVAGTAYDAVHQITLPTLGWIQFARSFDGTGLLTLNRTTSLDATGWTFTQTSTTNTDVEDPEANTVHYALNVWGLVQEISGSGLAMDELICYFGSGNDGSGGCTGTSPYMIQTTRTATDSGQYMVTGMAGPAYAPTQMDVYDWGTTGSPGALLRSTLTTYGENLNYTDMYGDPSLTADVADFPTNIVVQDGSGNQLSRTTLAYDETTPAYTGYGGSLVIGTRGNPTTVHAYKDGSNYLTSTVAYNDTGTVSSATDVNGGVTTPTYGACLGAFPTAIQEAVTALSTAMTWDCTGGVATSATDENGIVTETNYADPAYLWRPSSVVAAYGTGDAVTTTFTYTNASGSTAASVEAAMPFNSSASTSDALTSFDALGRPNIAQTRQGVSATTFDTVETDYDALGRPYRSSVPYSAVAGAASGAAFTTTAFDTSGRPTSITDANGAVTDMSYYGNDVLTTVTGGPSGENNKMRQTETNGAGDITSVCEVVTNTSGGTPTPGSGACSQSQGENGYWTTYAYAYASGQAVTTVVQNAQAVAASRETRVLNFDQLGRLLEEQNPESGATYYSFDSDGTCSLTNPGDMVKRVDAVGNTVCYAHDALHRLTDVSYPGGSYAAATDAKHFVYDGATVNAVVMAGAKGRIAEAYTGSSGSKITDFGFSYGSFGATGDVYESTPHSGGYYHMASTYWPNGALQTFSGLGLPTLSYGADGEGRTGAITASAGQSPVSAVSYNIFGQPTAVTLGSGDVDAFSFDAHTGRMTQYQFTVNSQTDTGVLTWNGNGSLAALAITDGITGSSDTQTCAYGYDDIMRIHSANCGSAWNQTFALDPFGNVNKGASPGTAFAASFNTANQITSVGSFTPYYDANGNLLDDPVGMSRGVYTWDADNRPATVAGTAMINDAMGRVVEEQSGSANTEFAYGPDGSKMAVMNGATITEAWAPLPNGGEAVMNASSGVIAYRHVDWLGSSRLTTATSGSSRMLQTQAIAPYGEIYANTTTTGASFTGKRQDTVAGASGIYDFLLRNESPTQSRWLTADPAGLAAVDPSNPQSWNRYAYLGNTPLTAVDDFGLAPCPQGMHPATSADIAAYLAAAQSYAGNVTYTTEPGNHFSAATTPGGQPGVDCSGLVMLALAGQAYSGGPLSAPSGFPNLTTGNINQYSVEGHGAVGDIAVFAHPGHVAFVTGAGKMFGSQSPTRTNPGGGPAPANFGAQASYWGNNNGSE